MPKMPLVMTFSALLLITSLTTAAQVSQNGSPKVRRQNLANQPSWTHPDFCSETGQIADVASLMVHPPGTKTLDYSSLCSEVLRPTATPSVTSTLTGDSVIIVTSTATNSISTTTTDTSRSTTTALCAIPTPLQRCSIPALGYAQNILYYRTNIDAVACHELCLQDEECKSFQVVPQDNGFLKFLRCNLYSTIVNGHVSETGDGEAVFWDRGCQDLLPAGCTKKAVPQDAAALDGYRIQKRDSPSGLKMRTSKDKQCCKIQRIKDFQHGDDDSSTDRLTEEEIQNIKIERREVNGYKLPLPGQETPEEAGRNGYKLLNLGGEDTSNGQNIQIVKRREYIPSRPARTAAPQPRPRGKNGYKLPLSPEETEIPRPLQPLPTLPPDYEPELLSPESQNTRNEPREVSTSDPLITPAPTAPPQIAVEAELELERQDRRIKKRDYTTPDFLATYFPLFMTFACSCLVSSAAPEVTRTVTDVVQLWSYTTTTSTKSEVYRYTEHPSWSTVYRTVG